MSDRVQRRVRAFEWCVSRPGGSSLVSICLGCRTVILNLRALFLWPWGTPVYSPYMNATREAAKSTVEAAEARSDSSMSVASSAVEAGRSSLPGAGVTVPVGCGLVTRAGASRVELVPEASPTGGASAVARDTKAFRGAAVERVRRVNGA